MPVDTTGINSKNQQLIAKKIREQTLSDSPDRIMQPNMIDIMANSGASSEQAFAVAECIGRKLRRECVIITPVNFRYGGQYGPETDSDT